MTFATKSLLAATALTLGLAAAPASAQVLGYDRGIAAGPRASGVAPGYDEYGRLNVFGARLEPRVNNGGLLGGVGNAVGGVVGGVGNAVGGVVGGVGTAVGGTVRGVTGAADDVVTGSVGGRSAYYGDPRYTAAPADRSLRSYR